MSNSTNPIKTTPMVTKDGSRTLFRADIDETYHSRNGAWEESLYVFVDKGLAFAGKIFDQINILEIGFGTGLNAILTQQTNTKVHYTGVEKFPLSYETVAELDYHTSLPASALPFFEDMHRCDWESECAIGPNFTLKKIEGEIETVALPKNHFNLIYFDAFAPRAQPELWEQAVFERLYTLSQPGCVLVTYCAQGAFKRNLKAGGFAVESLPGPLGKREMTRAIKLQ